MTDRELERLFVRFRDQGELHALARVFDRSAEALLRVARHLARDEASAEDLVQATFLAALENAARFDAERDLEAWLVGILTHQAQRLRARQERAPDPERLAAPASADPADDAELAEFAAALEHAIARVPEPYRSVLRRHLAEGRGAEEIARELDAPASTVRVRLHRGLRHLRRLLPAGFALGGAAIVASPRGLAAVRAAVLERGAGLAVTPTAMIAGGLLMSTKLVLAGCGVVVLGVAAWWGTRNDEEGTSRSAVSAPGAGATALETEPPRAAPEDPPAHARETADAAATEPGGPFGSLAVEVVWHDGRPAAGLRVAIASDRDTRPEQAHWDAARTDAEGRVRVERIRAGQVEASVDGRTPIGETDVVAGKESMLRIALERGVDVHGRVLDPRGQPVARATVYYGHPSWPAGKQELARTESDGTYALRSLYGDYALVATAPGFSGSTTHALRNACPKDSTDCTLDLVLREGGASVFGQVLAPGGEPVAEAWVRLTFLPMPSDESTTWASLWIQADARGEFLAEGLRAGGLRISTAPILYPCTAKELHLTAGTLTNTDLILSRGVVVSGRITRPDGTPARGVTVSHDLSLNYIDGGVCLRYSRVDDDGRYEVGPLPAGKLALIAEVRDAQSRAVAREGRFFQAADGDRPTWDFVLGPPHEIAGRVLDAEGVPVADWEVGAHPIDGPGYAPRAVRTDALGRFRITACVLTAHQVVVYAPRNRNLVAGSVASAMPDGEEHEIRVAAGPAILSHAFGRLLELDGTVAPSTTVYLEIEGRTTASARTGAEDGFFRLGPVAPGTHVLRIKLPGSNHWVTAGSHELQAGETRELGDVRVPARGSLTLGVRREDGVPLDSPSVALVDSEGRLHGLEEQDGGKLVLKATLVGTYRLRGTFRNAHLPERDVEIRAGEETQLELVCEPATFAMLSFRLPEGTEIPDRLRAEVRRAGAIVSTYDGPAMRTSAPGHPRVLSMFVSLPAGTYTWSAESGPEWTGSGSFVASAETKRHELDLRAR